MPAAPLRIASDALAAEISELGAELRTLTDAQSRDLLWDGDPAFWTGRAPLLFPIVGELAGGAYRLDGRGYPMPKHGFARRSTFVVVAHAHDRITLRLDASDATRTIYPFDFRLDVSYAITGATLTLTAVVSNLGEAALPASFGFHPAFRWPLPYGEPPRRPPVDLRRGRARAPSAGSTARASSRRANTPRRCAAARCT